MCPGYRRDLRVVASIANPMLASPGSTNPFPELADEREHLEHSRRCRDGMLTAYRHVLEHPDAADELTREYVMMTAAFAITNLTDPSCAEFFGRIDESAGDTFHIGRRHIEDGVHNPVVVDWRAPIAAPFYRATVSDNHGIDRRRRFTLRDGELIAYSDEHLDDPTAADIAGGIPDPVLAEMGAARTGEMREIVATIQAEQDIIIRTPIESCLVVQGGPGTGKTAVGLHRAAFLLFEHRVRLSREGVLVVGPNSVFLDYIGNVLPSLGERSVDQRTLLDLLTPRVHVSVIDSDEVAAAKGALTMTGEITTRIEQLIRPPEASVRFSSGVRSYTFEPDDWSGFIANALGGSTAYHQRRQGYRILVRAQVTRRSGKDNTFASATAVKAALDRSWPAIKAEAIVKTLRLELFGTPAKAGWSLADAILIDETRNLLDGPSRTYGHVVVDEAQDLSALALRCVARRCPNHSMTLLGDLAQSTAPGGQSSWVETLDALGNPAGATVEHLTIGYRVPGPILDAANELLTLAGVDVPTSRSARMEGGPPTVLQSTSLIADSVATVITMRRRHRLSGLIAPDHRVAELESALRAAGLSPCTHLHHLGNDDVPVIPASMAKGLELDGVIIVEPESINDGTPRGARLLYIAMTRAVQELTMVTTA